MSEEQNGTSSEQTALVEKLNQHLHDLESTLDDQQHALITRLFAERGVLMAMRKFKFSAPEELNQQGGGI